MPLLKLSIEAAQDLFAKSPMAIDMSELFSSVEYLGSNHLSMTPYSIFIVKKEGFEPGEYFVDIIHTVKIGEDGPSSHFEVKRSKDV